MSSLNKLNAAKIIRRSDKGIAVRLSAIRVDPAFNERTAGSPEVEQHIEALKRHRLAGGSWPNIVVKLEAEGVVLVDGHCRTEALRRAVADDGSLADAEGETWVRFDVFEGNDADAVAAIAQTNAGLKLNPVELGRVYKRLSAFDWPVSRIAASMQKSEEHVRQLLTLASANTDVQRMVAAGAVGVTEAVRTVRKKGAAAGAELAGKLQEAQAKGETRIRTMGDAQLFKAIERAVVIRSHDTDTGTVRLELTIKEPGLFRNLRDIAAALQKVQS